MGKLVKENNKIYLVVKYDYGFYTWKDISCQFKNKHQ